MLLFRDISLYKEILEDTIWVIGGQTIPRPKEKVQKGPTTIYTTLYRKLKSATQIP
jgi:hypothetical protein